MADGYKSCGQLDDKKTRPIRFVGLCAVPALVSRQISPL